MNTPDEQLINEFEKSWTYICTMRNDFINCVPTDMWNYSHHSNFAPLVKQFVHVIKVYGCYIDAFEKRNLDMSKKKDMFDGIESKENILQHLHLLDSKLKSILTQFRHSGVSDFNVNVFGMTMGFTEYTHVLIHHDTSHFGIWANYAAFGGFNTPKLWKNDWKL